VTITIPCPAQFGQYTLQERIGAGGMAEVFRAQRSGAAGFLKTVVVKRLHPRFAESPAFVQLFVEEAKLAAQVQHKNVVQVYELERVDDQLYMAMEWVDGLDLKHLLRAANRRQRRVPPWLALHAVSEILEALSYAHDLEDALGRRRNIVHCDVTPENVFLSRQGEIKLGDFGVAHDDTRTADPFPGQIRGKLPYMSPEQVSGQRPDERTDVFAAGVVLWECLAQRRLFAGGTPAEIVSRICAAPRLPPSHHQPDVPPALDALVLEALAVSHRERIPSARAFQTRISQVLAELCPRITIQDVRESLTVFMGPEEALPPLEDSQPSIDLSLDIVTDLSQLVEEEQDDALALPEEERAKSVLGAKGTLPPPSYPRLPRVVLPPPIPLPEPSEDAPETSAVRRQRIDDVVRFAVEESERAGAHSAGDGTPTSRAANPAIRSEPPQPRALIPRPRSPEHRALQPSSPTVDLRGLEPPEEEPPGRSGSTYAIVEPAHAVERLGAQLPLPPVPGTPARVETRDIVRGGTVPASGTFFATGPRGPRARPVTAEDARYWVRADGLGIGGGLHAVELIELLRQRMARSRESAIELSGDGARWMSVELFGRLLGEELLPSSPILPESELVGSLQQHSLTALFGRLARSEAYGCLVLVRQGANGVQRREVFLDRGRLVNVRSNQGAFDAWSLMLQTPGNEPGPAIAAIAAASLDALGLDGSGSPELLSMLRPARAKLMQAALSELFSWHEGYFGFDPYAPPLRAPGAPLELLRLLPGMVARGRPPEVLRAALDRVVHLPMERTARFEQDVAALGLGAGILIRVGSFGHGYTLAQSIATAGTESERQVALVLAYLFLELGLLRVQARV
jgi:serine/threonine protein kinase